MSYQKLYGLFADADINDLLRLWDLSTGSDDPAMQRFHLAIKNYCEQPLGTDITPKPIDYFLGLSGKHGQSWAVTQVRYKMRDFALKSAVKDIQQVHCCELRRACTQLGKEIKKFSPGILEKLRSGQRKINNELEQHIFSAFETNLPVSSNAVSLYRIVTSLQETGAFADIKTEL